MYSANSKDNTAGSKDAAVMKILADKSHALAMCYPVVYDGFLQWAGGDVSPMCNCLQNMHYEYTSHVTNVALWNNQTNDADKAKFRHVHCPSFPCKTVNDVGKGKSRRGLSFPCKTNGPIVTTDTMVSYKYAGMAFSNDWRASASEGSGLLNTRRCMQRVVRGLRTYS